MIEYRSSADGLRAGDIEGFFEGWPVKPAAAVLLRTLHRSQHVALALDADTGRLVGFANALTDGTLSAFIPLLEVLPEWRAQGVGSELVRRLLEQLGDIYAIDIVCDADVQPFYERLGFTAIGAMACRDRSAIGRANAGVSDPSGPSTSA